MLCYIFPLFSWLPNNNLGLFANLLKRQGLRKSNNESMGYDYMVCSNLWVESIFFPSRWRHVDHSVLFFVSSEQDDEETPWSAEIDKKLLCPKELIHKTKTDGFQCNKTGTQGPKSKLNNLYLTPELFCCELFLGGCMEYEWCGRHILVIHSFYCSFLQNQTFVGMFVDSWFPDILMSKTDFMNIYIYSQNQYGRLLEHFGVQTRL